MNERVRGLLGQMGALEEELRSALHEQESRMFFQIKGRRVEFERSAREVRLRLKRGLPVLSQRRERVIPFARGDGKYRSEIQYHGPGDSHDVVFLPIMGRHEDNRPLFHQGEDLA